MGRIADSQTGRLLPAIGDRAGRLRDKGTGGHFKKEVSPPCRNRTSIMRLQPMHQASIAATQ